MAGKGFFPLAVALWQIIICLYGIVWCGFAPANAE